MASQGEEGKAPVATAIAVLQKAATAGRNQHLIRNQLESRSDI